MLRNRQTLPFRFAGSLVAIATAAAPLAVSSPAAAQDRCYRVINLGPIHFGPFGDEALFGINNNDQGVFTAEVNGKKHAMLYLPTATFNLAAGCHDLHLLGDLDNQGYSESVVHDLNDAGIAVGSATINGLTHAFIWRVDTDPFQFIDLGTFEDGTWSEAWAINNDAPFPVVVGEGEFLANCECDDQGFQGHTLKRGFALELSGPDPSLLNAAQLVQDPDPNLGCLPNTISRDVNTPGVGDLLVVGAAHDGGGICQNGSSRATLWTNPILAINAGLALAELAGIGSSAWGVSNLGPIVGVSQTMASQTHAVFWPDPAVMAPLDLATLPGIPGGSQPDAYRINNLADIDVVGRSTGVRGEALLWECPGNCGVLGNWIAFDLNQQISDCDVGWTLYRADDVNDNGLIIGSGHRQGLGAHAFILEPQDPCCPADLDGDGDVGVSDFLILLGAWGPCPDCGDCGVECVADIDCNCDVGVSDHNILLGAWGPCGASDGGSSHHEALEQAVQEMGYDDVEDYQKWLAQASEADALASSWVVYALVTDGE